MPNRNREQKGSYIGQASTGPANKDMPPDRAYNRTEVEVFLPKNRQSGRAMNGTPALSILLDLKAVGADLVQRAIIQQLSERPHGLVNCQGARKEGPALASPLAKIQKT